jgi:uncharacterized iron-regulated membrane protein
MREIHSWSGLLFGWLLFAVFLTGTLTVFHAEITQWLQPEVLELSFSEPQAFAGRDRIFFAGLIHPRDSLQNKSDPHPSVYRVKLQTNRSFAGQTIDPRTGKMVLLRDTQGGDFFYHFHHGLLLGFPGAWIVGTAGMAMLVTLVTGLGVYRPGLRDFLVPRSSSFPHRAWVLYHNLIGTMAFPFALMITLTGLMISWSIYMPMELQPFSDRGSVLPLLSRLHFVQFGSATVSWLYFLMGLTASAMIATGLVLWTNKRRNFASERSSLIPIRFIESLNIATVAGLLISLAAFFWINRLLPLALIERSFWEIRCFFFIWCVSLVHSFLRGRSIIAWKEQLYAASLLLGFLPVLNMVATSSHLLTTIPNGQWAVAGVDLTAMAMGLLLGWIARRLERSSEQLPRTRRL